LFRLLVAALDDAQAALGRLVAVEALKISVEHRDRREAGGRRRVAQRRGGVGERVESREGRQLAAVEEVVEVLVALVPGERAAPIAHGGSDEVDAVGDEAAIVIAPIPTVDVGTGGPFAVEERADHLPAGVANPQDLGQLGGNRRSVGDRGSRGRTNL
jgi:hypothetical protein